MMEPHAESNRYLYSDPTVPVGWLTDHEVKRSEYDKMISSFVKRNSTKFIEELVKECIDAQSVRIKKSTD